MSPPSSDLLVREIRADDDLVALTSLIHSAYAPHAASGLRYWGTHQTVEDTAMRLAGGFGFVAQLGEKVIATITLHPPEPESKVPLLREASTWSFGQFCVSPDHKGKGIGRRIHDQALNFACRRGCRTMALNTAQPAIGLIAMYKSWGYEVVGTCDWRPHTNYLSVLMSKALLPPRHPNADSPPDPVVRTRNPGTGNGAVTPHCPSCLD